jgi:hypothetical protein
MSNVRSAVQIELVVSPRELSMRGRDAFEIGLVATNRGSSAIDPGLDQARLSIDGADSLQWAETIANGLREEKWFSLPPGESVSMSWPSMGAILFPRPGLYTLILRLGATESSAVVVRVAP